MGKEFKIEQEVELAAPPERVWKALTEDEDAWLFSAEELGGTVLIDDPPHHFLVRQEADGWFNQLEQVLEPSDGGTYLRWVHSGVFSDNWDAQYDGASNHTTFYLNALARYLDHFDGRPVQHRELRGPAASGAPDALDVIRRALGLDAGTALGDAVTVGVAGVDTAVLDFHNEYFVGLRTDGALYRFFGRNHFGGTVDLGIYDFAGAPDEAAWSAWLEGLYVKP